MPKRTLKYPYVQIKIEIRNRSRTTIPLIKGIHHPDTCTGQALASNTSTQSDLNGSTAPYKHTVKANTHHTY